MDQMWTFGEELGLGCQGLPERHLQDEATPIGSISKQTMVRVKRNEQRDESFVAEDSGCTFPQDLPNTGIEPRSPSLQANSLPAEPQGKPMNTGVGSLSLLQWIFRTRESNWGLLHCRQILY